jgi:uncharacterized membrane protein required for colicin V production
MLSISLVFWIFIVMFALIGALRGWAKEVVVSVSMILVLFIIQIVQTYVPWISRMLSSSDPNTTGPFCLWLLLLVAFALFGYHIPNVHKMAGVKLTTSRDRFQDWLLGSIIGAFNGYLLVGTIWFYLDMAGYPFAAYMVPPKDGDAAMKLLYWLPPAWLNVPTIYFAVAIAFTIVVIVFI